MIEQQWSYTVIYRKAEEGGYLAEVPTLKLVTQGQTLSQARDMAKDAIRGCLECLIEDGLEIPQEEQEERLSVRVKWSKDAQVTLDHA